MAQYTSLLSRAGTNQDLRRRAPQLTTYRGGLLMGFVATFALWAFGLLGADPATAQNRKKREPKVIQLEEIRIEGRVQKPNAFYILNRSQLGYEVMDLRTTFLREVVRTVQGDPF